MTFIERPPQLNGRGHLLLSPKLNFSLFCTDCIKLRLTLKLFYHNAQSHIVIKEYINEYLNVERKLELELITCFFLNPSLGTSTTDFARRSAIADLFRDGGEVVLDP